MKRFRIVDLDNCISDDSWRVPKIAWQHREPFRRYEVYHSLCGFDAPGNLHLLDDALQRGLQLIVMTGRPVSVRAVTEEWLDRAGISALTEHLLMRNNDDQRPSVEVKQTQLNWLRELYGVSVPDEIEQAFDDRQDIVNMYKRNGIRATRVWLHAVDAYTNPLNPADHQEAR